MAVRNHHEIIERILKHPDVVKPPDGRGEAIAWCPWHPDKVGGNPSLGINTIKRIAKCFVCGNSGIYRLAKAWSIDIASSNGRGGGGRTPGNTPAQLHTTGLTLAEYAAAKKLPVEELRRAGLTDFFYQGSPAIRIPYPTMDGSVGPVRFRLALHKGEGADRRFVWKSGSKPIPYGLSRAIVDQSARSGELVIVEGESDAHTLWHHGIAAMGIPGASAFGVLDRHADALTGVNRINVLIEPDEGGKTVLTEIGKSTLRDQVWTFTIPGYKDVSELHLKSPADFNSLYAEAKRGAVKWTDRAAVEQAQAAEKAWATCSSVSGQCRILDAFYHELCARGVVGEEALAKITYLVMTSRLLSRPVNLALKGPSAGGKSHTVEQTIAFFPPSAYLLFTGMSERALAYGQEPLSHKMLVVFEAGGLGGDFASYLMRSLLSEGRIRYETVEKTADGLLRSRMINREGPTGLITTTTLVRLHPENETRILSLTVNDSQDQTRDIMKSQAESAEGQRATPPSLEPWHALQTAIAASPADVVIPFATRLAEKIPPLAVRLRRDFPTILTLIQSHALLHQKSRRRDAKGRVLADRCDYDEVRGLAAAFVSEGVEATVPPTVRETVKAIQNLCKGDSDRVVTIRDLAGRLKLDRSTVERRVEKAIDRGYLRNLEDRKGKPRKLVPGDPLPDDVEILPTAESAGLMCACAAVSEGIPTPLPPPVTSPAAAAVRTARFDP